MGLFSKIFKGIKKVVKGVAKGIKKVVKGVAKVVKKVAKSKIFKAVLAAAAIYVTGGAALKGFGVTGGKLGAWAAKSGSGIFSSGLGKAIATPFRVLGTGLGKGARAITDFTGITEKGAQLGSDSLLAGGGENATMIADDGRIVDVYGNTVKSAAEVAETASGSGVIFDPVNNVYVSEATGKAVDAATVQGSVTKGSSWIGNFGKTVGTNVATNVATGYVMNKLTEEDPTGQMSGLALEGPSNLDPLAIYGQNGQPLSIAEAYGQLLYGTADPMYNQGNTSNLYTQDIAPVPAA
jgi:hypothetical protein|tara:strand:- start:4160 stop:5041 length:882 start_codon:yes stop_codon:yes gene_type:complete